MTTEQIDLVSVKRLIDNVWALKKQVQTLTEQLDKTEKERSELSEKVTTQDQHNDKEMEKLKSLHQAAMQNLQQNNTQKIDEMTESHNLEKQAMTESFDEQLKTSVSAMEEKNEALSSALEKISRENQAMINRIRGLAS